MSKRSKWFGPFRIQTGEGYVKLTHYGPRTQRRVAFTWWAVDRG